MYLSRSKYTNFLAYWMIYQLISIFKSINSQFYNMYQSSLSYICPIKSPVFFFFLYITRRQSFGLFCIMKFLPDDTVSPNITLQRLQITLVFAFGFCRIEKCHLNVIQLFLKGIYNFNMISRVYIELYILFCHLLNTGNTLSLYA